MFVVVDVVVVVGCLCAWLLVVLVFGCSVVVSVSCVVMFLFVHAWEVMFALNVGCYV